MITNAFQILSFLPSELFLKSTCGLADLKTSGSLGPVSLSLGIALVLAWVVSYGLALWRSPSKIRRCLHNKGMGLPALRDAIKVGFGTFAFSFLVALLVTSALAVVFYMTLYQQSFMKFSWWDPLVNSWLSSETFFSLPRPIPWGVLLGTLTGWSSGQLTGIFMGRKKGASGILITSRIHKPLKA